MPAAASAPLEHEVVVAVAPGLLVKLAVEVGERPGFFPKRGRELDEGGRQWAAALGRGGGGLGDQDGKGILPWLARLPCGAFGSGLRPRRFAPGRRPLLLLRRGFRLWCRQPAHHLLDGKLRLCVGRAGEFAYDGVQQGPQDALGVEQRSGWDTGCLRDRMVVEAGARLGRPPPVPGQAEEIVAQRHCFARGERGFEPKADKVGDNAVEAQGHLDFLVGNGGRFPAPSTAASSVTGLIVFCFRSGKCVVGRLVPSAWNVSAKADIGHSPPDVHRPAHADGVRTDDPLPHFRSRHAIGWKTNA